MRKIAMMLLAALAACLIATGPAAASSGGTFVFCAPYGGDLFSLDMHKTSRTQDYIVGLNINKYQLVVLLNHFLERRAV